MGAVRARPPTAARQRRGIAAARSPASPAATQNEQAAKLRDWTIGMMHYDKVLSGLKEISAKRPADDGSGSSSSSSDSDEEVRGLLGTRGRACRRA